MQTSLFQNARHYPVPKHSDMVAFRLQGLDVTKTGGTWVGLSIFLPGGGAERDAGPTEKIYVVLEGEITVEVEGAKYTLKRYDSCHIAAGEFRSIVNDSHSASQVLVIVPGNGG